MYEEREGSGIFVIIVLSYCNVFTLRDCFVK
jgi:hypothetical protein